MRSGPLRFIIIVVLLAAVAAAFLVWQDSKPAGEREETRMSIRMTPDMESVKVSWKPVDGTDLYVLYRADVTDAVHGDKEMPKRTEYQNLGDQNTNTTFTDVGAEENHFYSYIVEAYDSAGILIGDSYQKDSTEYVCVGMGTPMLLNYGYGEEHTNSKNELFLYMAAEDAGVSPEGAEFRIFRTPEGRDKYKELGSVKADAGVAEYRDGNVKPGKTYTYRVQEILKVDGESRESEMSEEVTIPAVNFTARYHVRMVKKASTDNHLAIKLKNAGKFNGETYLYPEDAEVDGMPLKLMEYSMDAKKWMPIPGEGVELPEKDPIFVRGVVTGQAKEAYDLITSDSTMLTYEGPGNGGTVCTLDLKTKKGVAYQDWD